MRCGLCLYKLRAATLLLQTNPTSEYVFNYIIETHVKFAVYYNHVIGYLESTDS